MTRDELMECLSYDPETGEFRWKVAGGGRSVGDIAGCSGRGGRIYIGIKKRLYSSHRLAWLYVHGVEPTGDIVHLNGNYSDNRIANLVHQTRAEHFSYRKADRSIKLTAERLREKFHYDAETGVFTRKTASAHNAPEGSVAGWEKGAGYRAMCVDGRRYALHRLVWLYVHGEWPKHVIDHINGDNGDNRMANLRDVAVATNIQNQRRAHTGSRTGLLGVYKHKGRFVSRIHVGGRSYGLGSFATPEEAHAAYVEAKRKLHAGCTI